MGNDTLIQFAVRTFNPWRGCEHALLKDGTPHPGCLHCYAESMSYRNPKTLGEWGSGSYRAIAAESYWKLPYKWNREARTAQQRERVFFSLGDPFEDREDLVPHRTRLFHLIDDCPWLDFLLFTKRPQNVIRLWPTEARYFHNIWLLYSVSDQNSLESWIQELLCCRMLVPVLGLSIEPQIGPVDVRPYLRCPKCGYSKHDARFHGDHGLCMTVFPPTLDWLILGGESGCAARPYDLAWPRQLLRDGREAGIPVFMKQMGADPFYEIEQRYPELKMIRFPVQLEHKKGGDIEEWDREFQVRQYPDIRREGDSP